MKKDNEGSRPHHDTERKACARKNKNGLWRIAYWFVGIGSIVWLLVRSGTRPKRLVYPCQRAAAVNAAGFLTYLAALISSATLLRGLKAVFSPARLALFGVGVLLTALLQTSVTVPVETTLADSPSLTGWTSPTAVSDVFVITDVPAPTCSLNGGDISGCASAYEAFHDDGVDALVNLMEVHGDYFYKTSSHPDGLFGADDVVVIKVNNQWMGRNSTNTDIVKGVVYRLVSHPDGFVGAVIIAENAQGQNSDWMNESNSNSQFTNQSYQEVTQAFAGEGYHVCIANWESIRSNIVSDYNDWDNDNGYVLEDADGSMEEQNHRRLSYPKFQVNCNGMNLSVSMKQGLWNGSTFDDARLKMINLPVLKRHNSAWATISIKNYLGFITTYDVGVRWVSPGYKHCWLMGQMDNSDNCNTYTNEYGLVGRQMSRIRRADLNIVDAIWVNPRDNAGWHGEAQRLDVLLSSHDPFAVDYYASDYILGPLIHTMYPSEPDYQQAMASTHGGWFRTIQLNNVARLRAEGVTDTINMTDTLSFDQERFQFNVYVSDADQVTSPYTFEDSFKQVSQTKLEGGEIITYTIVLYEETEATLTLTDTIPAPCTYVPSSATIEPGWKGPVTDTGGIYWSGIVTSTVPVTITFQVQVPVTDTTWIIPNRALVSRDGAAPVELTATSFLNGFYVYLPVVFRNY